MKLIENPANVSMPMHYIAFEVNNHGTLFMQQTAGVNHAVKVFTSYPFDVSGQHDENACTIEPGEMVMLMNYYRYVKRNNLHCDFINPNGQQEPPAPEKRYTVTILDRADDEMTPWVTTFTSEKRANAFIDAVKERLSRYEGTESVTVTLDAGMEDDDMYIDWIAARYDDEYEE